MHTIEPFFNWRDEYTAETDDRSPFFMREYDEFGFHNAIYNYYIHPQWDDFGSETLYLKILYTNYLKRYAIIEFIGEWNDAINNDIMHLKRNICDHLSREGIDKYIIICDNVLNYHGDDDSYYEEWADDARSSDGWIVAINILEHVWNEMCDYGIDDYVIMSEELNDLDWRLMKPKHLFMVIEKYVANRIKRIDY